MWLFSSVARSTPAARSPPVKPGRPPKGEPSSLYMPPPPHHPAPPRRYLLRRRDRIQEVVPPRADDDVRVAGRYHVAGGDQRANAFRVQAKGREVPRREDVRQGQRRQLLRIEERGRGRRRWRRAGR